MRLKVPAIHLRLAVSEVQLMCVFLSAAVNNSDCETMPMNEEKKNLEDQTKNGPKPILPYSSMFVFGQSNP